MEYQARKEKPAILQLYINQYQGLLFNQGCEALLEWFHTDCRVLECARLQTYREAAGDHFATHPESLTRHSLRPVQDCDDQYQLYYEPESQPLQGD